MANIASLINDPAWKTAIQQAIAVRALVGAVNTADQTPSRTRLDSILLGNTTRQVALATDMVTPVALQAGIRAKYEADGTWVQSDVEYVVEQRMIALALTPPINYQSIVQAEANEGVIQILTVALQIATNDVLSDTSATQTKLNWVRENCATPQKARETAQLYSGLIITSPQLRDYAGDLTGVSAQDISAAIGGFLTNWLRVGTTELT